MNQEEDITKMLIEVGETAKVVGVSSLTKMLKEIQKTKKDLSQQEYEKAMEIISVVCDVYQMSVADFFSNKRKNDRRFALGIVCYILNKEHKFDYKKISFITKKSFTYISILINEIQQMEITHPFDKKTLQKLDIIKIKLQNK